MSILAVSILVLASIGHVHSTSIQRETCSKKIDLAIVLDASASVGERNYKLYKQFANKLISRFTLAPGKTRIAVSYFSAYYHQVTALNDVIPKAELRQKVLELPYEASFTKINLAIKTLAAEVFTTRNGARLSEPAPPKGTLEDDDDDDDILKRKPGAKLVTVFLTDSFSSSGLEAMEYRAGILREKGIEIFVVGVPGENYLGGMAVLASSPINKHSYVISQDAKANEIMMNKLVKRICKVSRSAV
ncbi:predicted protein [Nematostella vectensis]|uniref:VWFA domain-containing protein n=1 Tax=Nematostella vectensis TaxID=45351 RepID=A7RJX9_NEMVE|nr:predicted protein [Nematostella vectensis]|eukprot:XP_001640227.1 predicted protein [Nematostella vectensis]